MVISDISNGEGTIVLTPNCSASWRANKLFIFALGGLTLVTAFFWTMVGAWVVMPFAGLEIGLFAYFMHRVCRQTHRKQVLYLNADQLRVESGIQYPVNEWQFARQQAFLRVAEAQHALDAHAVYLCDQKNQLELGVFLNQDDKKQLILLASAAGLPVKRHMQLCQATLPA